MAYSESTFQELGMDNSCEMKLLETVPTRVLAGVQAVSISMVLDKKF